MVPRGGCGVLYSVADAALRGVPFDVASCDYKGLVEWNRARACCGTTRGGGGVRVGKKEAQVGQGNAQLLGRGL